MPGPANQFVGPGGPVDPWADQAFPSQAFQSEVAELVNSTDMQAVHLRYRYRIAKEATVYVKFPVNHDKLLVFLAAVAPLEARGIRVDWSDWFASQ